MLVAQFMIHVIKYLFIFCRDGRQLYDLLSKTTDVSYLTVNQNHVYCKADYVFVRLQT